MITQFRRVNATSTRDPTVKSRTFVAPLKQGFLSSLVSASQEGQSITPTRSVLSNPVWRAPQRAATQFITGPGEPSCVAEIRPYHAVTGFVEIADPTGGGFGFFVTGGLFYLLISKIDENASDATLFVTKLATASTIRLFNTTQPTAYLIAPVSSTDYGTYSAIQFTVLSSSGSFSASDIFEITSNC